MLRNRLYYSVKPFIPRAVRLTLRRRHAQRIRGKCENTWPIKESAGRKPDGWPGWPDDKKFALLLTHDVESQRGIERVRTLAELEMEMGFRSVFNFIPEGSYDVPEELRNWLTGNGFEVGVHDLHHDGKLYHSRKAFNRSARQIGKYLEEWNAVGFRSAFMMRKLDWFHDLNIQYDTSTFDTDPFEPQPDGVDTIFPFFVTDAKDEKGFVELPYTLAQDSTLFLVLQEKNCGIWRKKTDWIAENGGMVLGNVHPDYLSFDDDKPEPDCYPAHYYTDFLVDLKRRYAGQFWPPLPRELASWYSETREHGTASPPASSLLREVGSRKVPSVEYAAPEQAPPVTTGALDPLLAMTPDNPLSTSSAPSATPADSSENDSLRNRRVAVVLLSDYPNDPRPRRAAEALTKEGLKVEVICLKRSHEEPTRDRVNGVDVLRIPMLHQRGGKLFYAFHYIGFLSISFLILTLKSLFRRYDFVHVHNMPDVLVFSAILPRLLGARIVLDLHDPMPELMRTIYGLPEKSAAVRLLKTLERWSIGFAHAAVTVNETCRGIFSRRSCALEKVSVVMNSPDEEIFALRPPSPERNREENRPFVIMFHGALVERNGLGLAVESIKLVHRRNPSVELRIYGDTNPFLESILASVEEEGLDNRIRYLGAKTIEEIVDAIDDCDLGIVPNLRNIFTELNTPTRIFEFLFRGIPVIAPSAPGIREYFGEDDLVSFELGDAEDLARKIEFVIDHPARVRKITERGQQVCAAHRWSEERRELVRLFRNLLCDKAVPQRTPTTALSS